MPATSDNVFLNPFNFINCPFNRLAAIDAKLIGFNYSKFNYHELMSEKMPNVVIDTTIDTKQIISNIAIALGSISNHDDGIRIMFGHLAIIGVRKTSLIEVKLNDFILHRYNINKSFFEIFETIQNELPIKFNSLKALL